MTLRKQITCGCLILLGLSLALALVLLVTIANHYLHAKRSHETLQLYREVLLAANVISAERGPTNAMLGGNFLPSSDIGQRLAAFRANSDAALMRIAQLDPVTGKNELLKTRSELADARLKVDAQLALPFEDRELGAIRGAIAGMFGAVDAILPLINTTALKTNESGESLADNALIGQKLFEIRDYAGRLGSILTPYIAKRTAITEQDQKSLQQMFGRIHQLWELTEPYLARHPALSKAIADVEIIFLGDGIDLVDKLAREASTGQFSFTTRSMTDALVPTFAPLEQVRLSYLDLMLKKADEKLQAASHSFFWVAVLSISIILIDAILVIGTQRMIFGPLLEARERIVLLAAERDLDGERLPAKGGFEIEEVFRAINVLRDKLVERREMTAQLAMQAKTDGLTGLLNRRSFDQLLNNTRNYDELTQRGIGLILVDIDRFKNINDTYGHAAGDIVLKAIASILADNVRADDVVARFGGEEFAILMEQDNIEILGRVAETLRRTIENTRIFIEPGRALNITASFGIATAGDGGRPEALFRAADQALYAAKAGGRNRVCLEASADSEPDVSVKRTNGHAPRRGL
jgi:diguanylate cyclase (GGDEF)-like protein